jgi:hypothetical protein
MKKLALSGRQSLKELPTRRQSRGIQQFSMGHSERGTGTEEVQDIVGMEHEIPDQTY